MRMAFFVYLFLAPTLALTIISFTMKSFLNTLKKPGGIFKPLIIAFLLFVSGNVFAQGNLVITPKRLVFDGTKRSEDINLANSGNDSATYVISFIQVRMKEDGAFETITNPDAGQRFADKYLRYFPRTVTLGPSEAQTVKVQLVRTDELEPGEYRSHLYFRAVPKEKPLGEGNPAKDSSISVQLVPIFGISIPTIIKIGESSATVNLANLNFKMVNDTLPTLQWSFSRSGNMSVYGDVNVNHISPQGKITPVGMVKGVSVYTPTAQRNFNLVLNNKPGIDFLDGKLHLVYSDQNLKTKLAEAELMLTKKSATASGN